MRCALHPTPSHCLHPPPRRLAQIAALEIAATGGSVETTNVARLQLEDQLSSKEAELSAKEVDLAAAARAVEPEAPESGMAAADESSTIGMRDEL
jgi:hypothetical protein